MSDQNQSNSNLVLSLDERQFWTRLEFRICREVNGMPAQWQRRYWCDGFIPEYYRPQREPPLIYGRVWMVEIQQQQEWKFILLLPRQYKSRDDIRWVPLVPPENATGWLTLDPLRQRIVIDPEAAVPLNRGAGGVI
jgi:hypothetical protein